MIYLWLSNKSISNKDEYNLTLDWQKKDLTFEKILQTVMGFSKSLKLIRLNKGPVNNTAVFLITPDIENGLDEIIAQLNVLDETIDISFFESRTNW